MGEPQGREGSTKDLNTGREGSTKDLNTGPTSAVSEVTGEGTWETPNHYRLTNDVGFVSGAKYLAVAR